MLSTLRWWIWRDLLLAMRRKTEMLTTIFFFIIVVTLFPLAVGPEMKTLSEIAPGVVWVAALLASMLSLNRMFADDYNDGTLEQMLLGSEPIPLLVLSKIIAHWLISGLPLVLISPILGMQMGLANEFLGTLVLTLLLGTPVLSLIGAVGAGLTLGVRGGGILLSLLVLPLYIPVLIFGAGAVEAVRSGLGADAHISLLGAFLVLAMVLAPWGTAAALKISLD